MFYVSSYKNCALNGKHMEYVSPTYRSWSISFLIENINEALMGCGLWIVEDQFEVCVRSGMVSLAVPALLHKECLSCCGSLVQSKLDEQDVVNRLQRCLLVIRSDVGCKGTIKWCINRVKWIGAVQGWTVFKLTEQ